MTRKPQATVIGDSNPSPKALAAAENVGRILASLGITVITGGRGGIMEAACRGTVSAGGITVGILPTEEFSDANQWCTVVIPTGLSHARNTVTALAGDFVVALGGGAGTLSEISFAWIHNKPILTLQGYDGWADKLGGTLLDHRRTDPIIVCNDLKDFQNKVVSICKKLNLTIAEISN